MKDKTSHGEYFGTDIWDIVKYCFSITPEYFKDRDKIDSLIEKKAEQEGLEFRRKNNAEKEIEIAFPIKAEMKSTIEKDKKDIRFSTIKWSQQKCNLALYGLNNCVRLDEIVMDVISNVDLINFTANVEYDLTKLLRWKSKHASLNVKSQWYTNESTYMKRENIGIYLDNYLTELININRDDSIIPVHITNKLVKNTLKHYHKEFSNAFNTKPIDFSYISLYGTDESLFQYIPPSDFNENSSLHITLRNSETLMDSEDGKTPFERLMGIKYEK
jgi:hypothetical protein